jgi:hypothetical protein
MKVAESCVTNWFGPSVNPAYVGVYQMKVPGAPLYRYWDGMHWYLGNVTPRKAKNGAIIKVITMANPKGSSGNPARVLKALKELGAMTNRELVEETGIPSHTMGVVLFVLRQRPKQMIRISGWVDLPYNGVNTRPLAQYSVGAGPDAPKPPPLGHMMVSRRIRAQKRMRVNSIFNIGNTDVKQLFPTTSIPTTPTPGSTGRRRPLQKAENPTYGVQHAEQP